MKKILLAIVFSFMLSGCGAEQPSPVQTPEPTLPPPVEYTIVSESPEEILALAELDSLKLIDARSSKEYDALIKLCELLPECEIVWQYEFQGNVL